MMRKIITKLVHKSHLINNFNCTNLSHMRSTSHSSAITELAIGKCPKTTFVAKEPEILRKVK